MARFLLIFLVIVGINYLFGGFRRRIFTRPIERPQQTHSQTAPEDELVQDPVCLNYVSRKSALTVKKAGTMHHFCSPACVKEFQKAN